MTRGPAAPGGQGPAWATPRGDEARARAAVRAAHRLVTFGLRYRWRELQLLGLPCIVVLWGAWLAAQPPLDRRGALPAGALFVMLLLAANLGLSWRAPWADQHLLPLAAFLWAIAFVFATAWNQPVLWQHVTGQILAVTLVVLLAAGILRMEQRIAERLQAAGTAAAPAGNAPGWRLWSGDRPRRRRPGRVRTAALAGTTLATVATGWWLGDLGAALVVLGALLALTYVAVGGGRWCLLAGALALAVTVLVLAEGASPHDVVTGPSTASARATEAIRRGAIAGAGIGRGQIDERRGSWRTVAIAEESGLAGLAALAACYAALGVRGLKIAVGQRRSGLKLLAVTFATALAAQAAVAIAAALALLPATNVPAPFLAVSDATNAFNLVALGLLIRISGTADIGAVVAAPAPPSQPPLRTATPPAPKETG